MQRRVSHTAERAIPSLSKPPCPRPPPRAPLRRYPTPSCDACQPSQRRGSRTNRPFGVPLRLFFVLWQAWLLSTHGRLVLGRKSPRRFFWRLSNTDPLLQYWRSASPQALVRFQGRGCADGVHPDLCHPLLLEALILQWLHNAWRFSDHVGASDPGIRRACDARRRHATVDWLARRIAHRGYRLHLAPVTASVACAMFTATVLTALRASSVVTASGSVRMTAVRSQAMARRPDA